MMFSKSVVLLLIIPLLNAHKILNKGEVLKNVKELHPDALLDISGFLEKYKYPLETHQVTTEDGYKLTMHRIPHGQNGLNTTKGDPKPAVLLLHGLLSSSMDFINTGPEKAIALLLADKGYDVWLGNSRGNTWSRAHETEDPDDKNSSFWDFSFHEMGYYDLPAKIDHILETTGVAQISYIGHSQGTTQFFVLASEKPEYNDKINVMVALAPVAYLAHPLHPLLKLLKPYYDTIFNIFAKLGIVEVLKYSPVLSQILATTLCSDEKYESVCGLLVGLMGGFDLPEWDPDFASVIVSNAPAGASVKQLKHFGQEILSGKFRQFEYDAKTNLKLYNASTPPDYDISKITADIVTFSSVKDWFASPEDVETLTTQLKSVTTYTVDLDQFSHIDFLWAKDVYSLLDVHVIDVLNEVNGFPTAGTTDNGDETTTSPNGNISSTKCPTTAFMFAVFTYIYLYVQYW